MPTLTTSDKVSIAYEHAVNGHESVVVICPGFFNSKSNRWMKKAGDAVSSDYDTIMFDFRGHGKSGGKFSWTAHEHKDLLAVLDYAAGHGYKHINILGFSLGAAASIKAASRRDDIDKMVLISSPYSFWKINYHFWEPEMFSDLKDNIECNWEGKGAKVTNLFLPKPKPLNSIKNIKHTPIFFIHGDKDWVIKPHHSERLFRACPTPKKLEIIKDGLHAERLIQQHPDRMKSLILSWFKG